MDFLEVLELRVAVLRVLTPDQLGPEEESPQGRIGARLSLSCPYSTICCCFGAL